MKRSAISAFLFLTAGIAFAGDFTIEFEKLKKAGDEGALRKFLAEAAPNEAENPDFYATAGNYWWGVAESVAISRLPAGDFTLDPQDFSIQDPKTGKTVGTIGKAGKANPEIRKRALIVLSDGARKFPRRADIALGLAHVQKQMGLPEAYVSTLTTLLAEAKKDPGALEWKGGGALPKPAKTFLPETVQGYSAALFNANSPATDALCAKLLKAVTDAFPNHPYAYNLQAALADATGKPEEALVHLEIARAKAPDDPLILMNLGGAYEKSGQKKKAEAVYEAILKLETGPESHRRARAALESLGKPSPASPVSDPN